MKTEMEHYRANLEQTLIGACLLENAYQNVAGILVPNNFQDVNPISHKTIFQAIESLYPNRPIDIITVTREIGKPGYGHYLAECMSRVSSSANIRYHASILLELNMRDVLVTLLRKANSVELSTTTKAGINEILDETIDWSSDILEIYSTASGYLESLGAEAAIVSEIQNLQRTFEEKLRRIKRQGHIDCLIQNLKIIGEPVTDPISRLALDHAKELIKFILISGKIDSKSANQLISINPSISI